MATSAPNPASEPLVSQVAELLDGDGPIAQALAAAYLRRLGADAVDELDLHALAHEIRGVLALSSGRPDGAIAVRAFTPTVEANGYATERSVLETSSVDMPFLVDSVKSELDRRGIGVVRARHPVVGVRRGEDGRLLEVGPPGPGLPAESIMHFDLDRRLETGELAALQAAVHATLVDTSRAVRDFPAMAARLEEMTRLVRAEGDEEVAAFLDWLGDEHFVFLGAREYAVQDGLLSVVPGSGLGLLEDPRTSRFADPAALAAGSPTFRLWLEGDEPVLLGKANRLATVRRRIRPDDLAVRRRRPDGETVGVVRIIGLLGQRAATEPASRIPIVRGKLRELIEREGLVEGSHDHRAAVALLESFPRSELLATPVEELRRLVTTLLAARRDQVRLLANADQDGHSASLVVALPRVRYSPEVRERLPELLRRRLGADDLERREVLGEDDVMRVHLALHRTDGELDPVEPEALEADVRELARNWEDRVEARLVRRLGADRGEGLAALWLPRLPEAYRAASHPDSAAHDVESLDELVGRGEDSTVRLRNEGGLTRVVIFTAGQKRELSTVMPLLEDLGLRVVEERPTGLHDGDEPLWLQDFGVLGPDGEPLDLEQVEARVIDTVTAIRRGECESDSLHRLLLVSDLDWRQIAILRAYRRYRQRVGSRFTERYQNDAIVANAAITSRMMELFAARFDPDHPADAEAETAIREGVLEALEGVASLDEDRILRNQLGLIDATVRTNAYQPDRRVTAFKLRSAEIVAVPQPAPLFEIYVYSPGVEGIHLRGGKIARGGIRWSNRMDYRTEVFGLMRAQMTKNAVIVPTGAKGGFYVRDAPTDPGALKAEVERRYVDFIEGLLDVTDNLVDGAVVGPERVRAHDEPDTYLVVAADKGTATFSDVANGISERRGFWLGDAFASGGSTGYDHKALGITARGAWESLKRHFASLGLDPQVDVFTVVGIGDMSGDVFGNGMTLSRTLKLVGAFDHRHVFLDPAPDPATSYAERERLKALPGSSWADYDPALISPGGGVFPRGAKSIALTPEVRAALGVDAPALSPAEVIQAILRAPVDVLWNGGIGTVVKASAETDADAMDRSSDAIRVDARDLRARTVVEGGNLGLTQRARIEYAAHGGINNADFVDNSAGVDCSDHEVNIKILLDTAVKRGELTPSDRNALLLAVTDDVIEHVLLNSSLQARIVAREFAASHERLQAYDDLMARLEAGDVPFGRRAEALPSSELIADRRREGRGMERPELAVLIALAKRHLVASVLESDTLADDPHLEADLLAYFPDQVGAAHGHLLAEHPVRRELVASLLANDLVHALGATFVTRLVDELAVEPSDVVRAYRIAREVSGAREFLESIRALDGVVEAEVQAEMLDRADWLMEGLTRWYLRAGRSGPMGPIVAAGRRGFERLEASLTKLGSTTYREDREATARKLMAWGVPADLAFAHAFRLRLVHVFDLIEVAEATGRSVEEAAVAFQLVGEGVDVFSIEDEIEASAAPQRTQRWALNALREDVYSARAQLTQRALQESPDLPAEEAIAAGLARRADALRRLAALRRTLGAREERDVAALALAVRQLRSLV